MRVHGKAARATFADDREAGYVTVPEKATEEMLTAAMKADEAAHPGWASHETVIEAANAAGAVREE